MPVCCWLYFRVIHSDACLLLVVLESDPQWCLSAAGCAGSEVPGCGACRAWSARQCPTSCRSTYGRRFTWTRLSPPCCTTCRTHGMLSSEAGTVWGQCYTCFPSFKGITGTVIYIYLLIIRRHFLGLEYKKKIVGNNHVPVQFKQILDLMT